VGREERAYVGRGRDDDDVSSDDSVRELGGLLGEALLEPLLIEDREPKPGAHG
jgi:hypothetical protein